MTAVETIKEIERHPPDEQARVIEFARHTAENQQLRPEQLGRLARQMVEANDPAEVDRLQAEIVRGFDGNQPHA